MLYYTPPPLEDLDHFRRRLPLATLACNLDTAVLVSAVVAASGIPRGGGGLTSGRQLPPKLTVGRRPLGRGGGALEGGEGRIGGAGV